MSGIARSRGPRLDKRTPLIECLIDRPRPRVIVLIRVGSRFRLTYRGTPEEGASAEIRDFLDLTRGEHETAINPNRGIWPYPAVRGPSDEEERIPAIVCQSNPFSSDSARNPWIDIIEPDEGFVLYNGDNKAAGTGPFEVEGNKAVLSVARLYGGGRRERELAPPFLIFRHVEVNGRRSGFREFCGYGVPIRLSLRTQRAVGSDEPFLNLVVELSLFDLPDVNSPTPVEGELDWQWINDRRNSALSSTESNKRAPPAWMAWLQGGDPERCRRNVLKSMVRSKSEQMTELPTEHQVLQTIYAHYQRRQHEFEGFAARITANVIGDRCTRRWVTKRSGDGGVDFVNLLKVGDPQSRAAVIVLGQAKCIALNDSVDARDLARLVARLRRGWIGSFVTTGSFTEPAQGEVIVDGYPLLLIPGRVVAREARKLAANEGGLEALLSTEADWYGKNVHDWPPIRAADDAYFGVDLPLRSPHSE
jgi:hypothetical protein